MMFLLSWIVQVTIILLVTIMALPLFRKRSAASRHLLLSTAVVFSMLIPAANAVMPVWDLSALVSHRAVAPVRDRISAITSPRTQVQAQPAPITESGPAQLEPRRRAIVSDVFRRLPSTLFILWGTGVLVGCVVLATGVIRLVRIVSASLPMPSGHWRRLARLISSEYRIKRSVHLLESRNSSVLVTWGVMAPKVILPSGAPAWPEDRVSIVLRHELAHIRRRDWIMQMMAQALRTVHWFNPLVWMVCRRLRLESECACDDSVLSNAIEGHEYAEHLLDLARFLNKPGESWSAALTMARPSTIERRFSAMLDPNQNRRPVTRLAIASTVVIGLFVTLGLSAARGKTVAPSAAAVTPVSEKTIMAKAAVERELPVAPTPQPRQAAPPKALNLSMEGIVGPSISTIAATVQKPVVGDPQGRRGRTLDRALFEAAEEGNEADADDLIRAGANVNGLLPGDGTPLIAAAREGRLTLVRYLLERGADPNLPSAGDGNPLIVSAREGYIEVVRLLLDRGADPNGAVNGAGNALIMAAREGHAAVVTLLLDRGAIIDQMVPGDENALIGASGEGYLDVVKLLVSRRADVNARVWVEPSRWRPNGEWRTPLSEARGHGHQDVVQFLLSVGARD